MIRSVLVAVAVALALAVVWSVRSRDRADRRATAAVAASGGAVPDDVVDAPGLCEAVCGSECAHGPPPLRCPRRCRADLECAAGSRCAWSRLDAAGERVRRCLRSECATPGSDAECGPGRVCLAITTALNRCQAAGVRRAGEPCSDDDDAPAVSCAVGLRCADRRCQPAR